MTLDNDTGHFPPSPPRISYNPFDSDDETSDTPGLKSEIVFTEQDHIGFDLKALDESADALDNRDLSWEEAVFGQPAMNPTANGQLYTDKNVTECELPEILVCYRENNNQSVKDIGVDEGMPVQDKIWVPISKDETKDCSTLLDLIRESDDSMKSEKRCCQVDDDEMQKSKLACVDKDDGIHSSVEGLSQVVNENFIKITELKLEEVADCNTTKIETPPKDMVCDVSVSHQSAEMDPKKSGFKQTGEPDSIGKDGRDNGDTVTSPDEVGSILVQDTKSEETLSNIPTEYRDITAKLDKSPNVEDTLPSSSKNVVVRESAHISDSNTTGCGNEEEKIEHVESEKPPTYQSMTRQEEPTSTSSTVSIPEPRFHGETSFSSITFTGPVSYSGNISLRSESSAGSTRSFAFPILQTEGNSSPERMVKADQRLLRKQKGGWVQALVCCRF